MGSSGKPTGLLELQIGEEGHKEDKWKKHLRICYKQKKWPICKTDTIIRRGGGRENCWGGGTAFAQVGENLGAESWDPSGKGKR